MADYERPMMQEASFSSGVLTGAALLDSNMLDQMQDNIGYRVKSAKSVLTGDGSVPNASPVSRRLEIRNRRMEMLRGMLGMGEDEEGSSSSASRASTSRASTSTDSGSISGSGRSGSGSSGSSTSPDTREHSTPSMSSVDTGTRGRALERGYDG